MKVLVIYDSSYGNTEAIAKAICSGLKEGGLADVVCKKAAAAATEDFKNSDAWIVGSPTHIGGPTGEAKKAMKIAFSSGRKDVKGTAFDTRFANTSKGASDKLQSMMEKEGVKILLQSEWFVVAKTKGPLGEDEETKAVSFGKRLADSLRSA